jgi:Fe-S-cluster containining protein
MSVPPRETWRNPLRDRIDLNRLSGHDRASLGGRRIRRLRIAIVGASPCGACVAACCKQNGHAYSVLLEGREQRKFAPFAIDAPIACDGATVIEKVLPYRDGRCIFLGEDDLCAIYDDRPVNCRRFDCIRAYHHGGRDVNGHGAFLERNPAVTDLLDRM